MGHIGEQSILERNRAWMREAKMLEGKGACYPVTRERRKRDIKRRKMEMGARVNGPINLKRLNTQQLKKNERTT